MEPLVSVIVPVYGVEQYLERCVDSILAQTYGNLEVILVDDGSPDACPLICDRYAEMDGRVVVIHKENGGLSDARNRGLDEASGEYVTFVDSDDYIEENCVEMMLSGRVGHGADISCGKHRVVYPNTVLNEYTGRSYVLSPEQAFEMMLYGDDMDVSAWAKLYRRKLFEGIRYPVGRNFEDTATTYRLIDRAGVIYLDSRPVYNYVIRPSSITTSRYTAKKMELIDATKDMTEMISEKYPSLGGACRRRMIYSYLSTLSATIYTDDVDKRTLGQLMSYIRRNGGPVLRDPKAPARDKIGIVCSFLGYGVFKSTMKIYRRIRNKES